MTPDEAADNLRAAGHRVIEPKRGDLPKPINIPGMEYAIRHRDCCEDHEKAEYWLSQLDANGLLYDWGAAAALSRRLQEQRGHEVDQ